MIMVYDSFECYTQSSSYTFERSSHSSKFGTINKVKDLIILQTGVEASSKQVIAAIRNDTNVKTY